MKSIIHLIIPYTDTTFSSVIKQPLAESIVERKDQASERKHSTRIRAIEHHHTMRPTLLLRAGQYTPKIQFMGSKWKEAKSKSTPYCAPIDHSPSWSGDIDTKHLNRHRGQSS